MYGNPGSRTYGPEKISFTSALAREEWAKYAREVYGDTWKKVYQAAMKRRLQQITEALIQQTKGEHKEGVEWKRIYHIRGKAEAKADGDCYASAA